MSRRLEGVGVIISEPWLKSIVWDFQRQPRFQPETFQKSPTTGAAGSGLSCHAKHAEIHADGEKPHPDTSGKHLRSPGESG